ncbi:MAG: hypothetical protein PHF00_05900 [Elusimicrobia bacterium]|nr:hypothetical protein [Elusimicrobiota bacterium]
MRWLLAFFLSAAALAPGRAQEYGAKGIYPVYETGGQWVVFDKKPGKRGKAGPLAPGARLLVVGSSGAELFAVARASATYGGACRGNKPVKLRAALLRGPRSAVGKPIIGIKVPPGFSLQGSRAKYLALGNEIDEAAYGRLGEAARAAVVSEIKSGEFLFSLDDDPGPIFREDPRPERIQLKFDFGARVAVAGLKAPFVLVDGAQVFATFRRCLRLADGGRLVGGCAQMPHALMAETALLRFVVYDPGGRGNPILLAYTPEPPLWGDERWGFSLRAAGPKLFLSDALDPRCRESF